MYRVRTCFIVWAGLLCLAILLPRRAAAAWPTDPAVNVPLCTAPGDQLNPAMVSDGAGGAIVAWEDYRDGGLDANIYVQRISVAGTVMWAADGVALCTATGNQQNPGIVSDGAGGAIVIWHDYRSGGDDADVYAQRISANGNIQWPANGVTLGIDVHQEDVGSYVGAPAIAPDGAGGAIVAWVSANGTGHFLVQRVSAEGAIQWPPSGVPLNTATPMWAGQPAIVSGGLGGAIVCWEQINLDYSRAISAQRILADGTIQWAANGTSLGVGGDDEGSPPAVLADGAGGAMIAWAVNVGNPANPIEAKRISAAGLIQWAETLNPLPSGYVPGWPHNQARRPMICEDGAGGAIVSWQGNRGATSGDWMIYAQRVSASGTVQWGVGGVEYSPIIQGDPAVPFISDGAGGVIGSQEILVSNYPVLNHDIYVGRLTADGWPNWGAPGWLLPLCSAAGNQVTPAIVADGLGGAIVSWSDGRSGTADIYAQQINSAGRLGGPAGEAIITTFVGPHGSMTPSGTVSVARGSSLTVSIVPDTNYWVDNVAVDGISVGAPLSYTFSNVTFNHTVSASFAPTPPAPRNLTATVDKCDQVVRLRWSDVSAGLLATEIDTKVAGSSDALYAAIATTPNGTIEYDDHPNDGVPHTYRVRSYAGSDISAPSNEVSAEAPGSYIAAPSKVSVKSLGDAHGLRVRVSSPIGTTSWAGVSAVVVEQSVDPEFSHLEAVSSRSLTAEDRQTQAPKRFDFFGNTGQLNYFRAYFLNDCGNPGGLTLSQRPVAPVQAPVMLVHGWRDSPSAWSARWTSILAAKGIGRIYRMAFTCPTDNWEGFRLELQVAVQSQLKEGGPWQDDEAVDIVAHSQGGLAARSYIEEHGGSPLVRTLFMLATPNHGGHFSDFGAAINAIFGGVDSRCRPTFYATPDLEGTSPRLAQLNFNNLNQVDNVCNDEPQEVLASRNPFTTYFTLAGTGPSVLSCLPLHCRRNAAKHKTEDCAGDGVVPAKSVRLRALDPQNQWTDAEIPGLGVGLVHNSGLAYPGLSEAILEADPVISFVGDRLLRLPVSSRPALIDARSSNSSRSLARPIPQKGQVVAPADSFFLLSVHSAALAASGTASELVTTRSLSTLTAYVAWDESALPLRLIGPDATIYTPSDTLLFHWLHFETNNDLGYSAVAVDNPQAGGWGLSIGSNPGPETVHYELDWIGSGGGGYEATASVFPTVVTSGEAAIVQGTLTNGGVAVEALAEATIIAPSGEASTLELADDGTGADQVAQDGVYAGRSTVFAEDGTYVVRTAFTPVSGDNGPLTVEHEIRSIVRPGLHVTEGDLVVTPAVPNVDHVSQVRCMLHNDGAAAADSALCSLIDFSTGDTIVTATSRVSAHDSVAVVALWTPVTRGNHRLFVALSSKGVEDLNALDDTASVIVPVFGTAPTAGVSGADAPLDLALWSPRPNPSRGTVVLAFDVPQAEFVKLEIFDVQGRRVRFVMHGLVGAGRYTPIWNRLGDAGQRAQTGVYFVRLTTSRRALTRKFVLLD